MQQVKSSMNKSQINKNISEFILRFRLAILTGFIVALLVFGFYVPQFKINASADTLLTKGNRLYIETQIANQKFSPAEFILIAYKPDDGDVFSSKTFADLTKLSTEFKRLDRVSSVTSILNVPLIESSGQLLSSGEVTDLTYNKQAYSPEKMRELLTDHPIFTDLLVNRSQDATAIQIVFENNEALSLLDKQILALQVKRLETKLDQSEKEELATLEAKRRTLQEQLNKERRSEVEQIEEIVTQLEMDATVYIGGSYVVGIRLIDIVTQDLITFGIGVLLLISVLLLILFRNLKWVFFPLFACASSVTITVGILALLKIPATVISANFIALQLILTLAIMLHLIVCYRSISQKQPEISQHERIKETLRQKLAPCFYAAITTSVGFASLAFSGIQPIMDFGLMMLISNAVTLLVALFLFPSVLSFLKAKKESNEFLIINRLLGGVQKNVAAKSGVFIIIPVVLIALVSLGIPRLNVENSFIDYFDTDTQIYNELRFIDQEFGGSTPLDVLITLSSDTDKTDLFMSAEQVNTLHLAHAVIDAFEASGNVTSLINFTTLAKQLNDGKPLTEYELDVIYSVVDQKTIDSLIGSYIDSESNTFRVSTRIEDTMSGLNRQVLLDNINKDLAAAGFTQEDYQLTNLFVLYQDILSRLVDSQVKTIAIVYAALSLILFVIFRSFTLTLIALVPNVLTTAAILGVIGWFNIPLDLMTITIASIAMGIAIDDTIHFMDAYVKNKDDQPMQAAFSHTGMAMLYTTSLIAAGFGIFVFSEFMPSVYFGILTACAMLFALLTDLTVLPALLKKFSPQTKDSK
jgi:predicted RND superfamily exporter protein